MHQGARDRDPLQLAARQLARHRLRALAQAHRFQHVLRARDAFARAHALEHQRSMVFSSAVRCGMM